MEQNVANATRLYSEAKEESGLIYPTYKESKQRFKKAFRKMQEFNPEEIDENQPIDVRIDYV
ncbi:hypothetical protein Q2440_26115, partial [Escherichia coli]|nr:hypothetical protein [Escherichia coli]